MARIAGIILAVMMMICPSWGETLRVISLYPGHSDNIFAMGGSEILVALSENDDDDLLPSLPRISLRSGAERMLALRPDAVITRPFAERLNPNVYDVLRGAGVKVISLDPPEWDAFPEYLRTLANALNLNPDEAISRLDSIRGEISREAMSANHPRVFLEATSREIHTCSPGSWAARLIELAGGVALSIPQLPLTESNGY